MANLYIDKLDHIINECNYKYHITIKMKRIKVKDNNILTLLKKLIINILNLKLLIMVEHQNTKTFLLKYIVQISLKKFL